MMGRVVAHDGKHVHRIKANFVVPIDRLLRTSISSHEVCPCKDNKAKVLNGALDSESFQGSTESVIPQEEWDEMFECAFETIQAE